MDLRIEKTKTNIVNAFILIRKTKPLEKITIKELCELAKINNSTFYCHYTDIFDLADTIETDFVNSVILKLSTPEDILENTEAFAFELFDAMSEREELLHILFGSNKFETFAEKLEIRIKELVFAKYPMYKDDPVKNVQMTFCIQGANITFLKSRQYGDEVVIPNIVEMVATISNLFYESEKI